MAPWIRMALSPPSHSDNAVALKLASVESEKNAPPPAFHQDDLWTSACGSYQAEHGIPPTSSDDLNSMVSMAACLQQNHQTEAPFSSGLHRNASFDSGSTSHDSCTPSFSTGSPVTVLPPYNSCGDLGFGSKRGLETEQENSFAQYYPDGLWIPQDLASDCDQMLVSSGGDGNFSSLLNELPLRSSYHEGVDQVCANNDYQGLECMVSSLSSQHSYKSSTDNSGSTPESRQTGIEAESSFGQEFLVGPEDASDHSAAVSDSPSRSTSPRTSAVVDSHLSQTARRRLSWSDHHWPSSATQPNQALLHNPVDSNLSKAFVNGFNARAVTNFQDADYIATCNQYRKGVPTANAGGGPPSTLKRPYSAMQSTCSVASSALADDSHALLKFSGAPGKVQNINDHQQDAAALSALLYKNNHHGSELFQQHFQVGSLTSSASAAVPREAMLPPPKLRRRHGTATDPQSIAARLRREKFSDRVKVLQSLVPNGERLDTVSMLGHTLEYVRFLQHQVWQLYNGTDDGSLSQPDSETREKWKEFMESTQHLISS